MMREAAAEIPEFLTSDQVIQRLLSQPSLRRQATTCVLPAVRVGAEWRFRKADLEQWIAQQVCAAIASGPAA
jgi:excisionase family DNA binding protein